MRGMNVALHGLLVLLTTLLVALPLFAQTLEQKRLMYTISPEEKQCRVDRLKELMELVKAAKTEAEMDRYGMLADETRLNKACAAKVAAKHGEQRRGHVDLRQDADLRPKVGGAVEVTDPRVDVVQGGDPQDTFK